MSVVHFEKEGGECARDTLLPQGYDVMIQLGMINIR